MIEPVKNPSCDMGPSKAFLACPRPRRPSLKGKCSAQLGFALAAEAFADSPASERRAMTSAGIGSLYDSISRSISLESSMLWTSMLLDHTRDKFAVGATTFALQIPTRTFGSAISIRTPKPRPALQVSEVAFSVYYPTHSNLSTKKHRYLDWVVR